MVLIRGGGAKSDLAWLNDGNVAAWICRLPIPVFTGIGHEIDECVLDLVAHRKFDTPSKVIGHIKTCLHSEAAGLRADIERGSSLMQSLGDPAPDPRAILGEFLPSGSQARAHPAANRTAGQGPVRSIEPASACRTMAKPSEGRRRRFSLRARCAHGRTP